MLIITLKFNQCVGPFGKTETKQTTTNILFEVQPLLAKLSLSKN